MAANWKPVVGFESSYEVSDCGVVRSIDRISPYRQRKVLGRVRKTVLNYGYPSVMLKCNGLWRTAYVHTIVLEAFVGPCPDGMECCHNDGNRSNTSLSNLRWDTPKNNQADRVKHGTTNRGELHGSAKLTPSIVADIKSAPESWGVVRALGRKYGIAHQHISDIRSGKRWAHIGIPA